MSSGPISDAQRTYRVIVAVERLTADLEAHTEMLAQFIEEERATRRDTADDGG